MNYKDHMTPTQIQLNELGGRSEADMYSDEEGSYVYMTDGNFGLYKYYL